MAHNPQFGVGIVHLLGRQLREAHQQLQDLHLARVEQRIARTVYQDAASAKIALSQSTLATQSDTTIEAVRYILDRWERSGIVLVEREQLHILNSEALRAIADDRIAGFK